MLYVNMLKQIRYYDRKLAELFINGLKTIYGVACYSIFLYSVVATLCSFEPEYIEGVTSTEDMVSEIGVVYSLLSAVSWIAGAVLFLVVPVRNLWLLSVLLFISAIIGILNV
jgi:hypothetical protein